MIIEDLDSRYNQWSGELEKFVSYSYMFLWTLWTLRLMYSSNVVSGIDTDFCHPPWTVWVSSVASTEVARFVPVAVLGYISSCAWLSAKEMMVAMS